MAIRKENIIIKQSSEYVYEVWADSGLVGVFKGVEGVYGVYSTNTLYIISIDQRYDPQSVMDDICAAVTELASNE